MGSSYLRLLCAALVGLALVTGGRANAAPKSANERIHRVGPQWCESHVAGDDVRFTIDAHRAVRASRTVRLQVTGGALRDLDVDGLPVSAELGDTPNFIGEDGSQWPARVSGIEARPGGASSFRLSIIEPRGLRRGLYSIQLDYSFDGEKEGLLRPVASGWRFNWTSPPARDGRDSVRVWLSLPRGESMPREVPDPLAATMFLSSRHSDHDEVELTRAHVTRGDAVSWAVLIDASSFELSPRGPQVAEGSPSLAREITDDRRSAVTLTDLLTAALAALGLWVAAFVQRGVGRRIASAGALLVLLGAVGGIWLHAALAPAGLVAACALARVHSTGRMSRVRVGTFLVVGLGSLAVFAYAAPWFAALAVVVAAALSSALELVLTFAEWHRAPGRRLDSLARGLIRSGLRVTREGPEMLRVRGRMRDGVRAVWIECVRVDLVVRLELDATSMALPRVLVALGRHSARKTERGTLIVTAALPRWMSRAVVIQLVGNLGDRRRARAAFSGEERRQVPARPTAR